MVASRPIQPPWLLGAALLVAIFMAACPDEPDWTDVPRTAPLWLIKIAGEFAKAAHWGLIEQKKNDDPAKRCSGLWRATARGKNFAHGLELIPTHVYLFDNKVVGFEGEETTIQRALGNRFNYEELMRGIHPSELSRVTQKQTGA